MPDQKRQSRKQARPFAGLEIVVGLLVALGFASVLAILLWPRESQTGRAPSLPPTLPPTPPPSDAPVEAALADYCTTGCIPLEVASAGEPLALPLDAAAVNPQLIGLLQGFGAANVSAPVASVPAVLRFDPGFLPSDAQVQQLLDVVVAAGADPQLLYFDANSNATEGTIRILALLEPRPPAYSGSFVRNQAALASGYSLAYGAPCSTDC